MPILHQTIFNTEGKSLKVGKFDPREVSSRGDLKVPTPQKPKGLKCFIDPHPYIETSENALYLSFGSRVGMPDPPIIFLKLGTFQRNWRKFGEMICIGI